MLFRRSHTAGVLMTLLASTAFSSDHDGQHSHVHGAAELMVALEGNSVEIMLESPAANIVGFEHKATSAEQIAAVEQAEALLKQPLTLFALGGQCRVSELELNMDAVEPEAHEQHHDHEQQDDDSHQEKHHDEHKHDHDEHEEAHDQKEQDSSHGEVGAHYHFKCQNSDQIDSITINLGQYFPAIESLSVAWVTENGQGAMTLNKSQLTGSQRTMTFR